VANPLTPAPAAHRQTHYTAAPVLDPPVALPLPQLTSSIEQAVDDLSTFGLCLLTDVLTAIEVESLRAKLENQVEPPPREMAVQIEAPAGSVFAWDGRLWHGTGVNRTGHPRRHVGAFFCLPWMRQQENWGVSCLQEVLDEASPKLKARLGLRTYGTLGGVNGTHTDEEVVSLGNSAVSFPEYIIGENGTLHPLRRVSRDLVTDPN